MADEKSPPHDESLGNGDNVKNQIDMLIFHIAKCVAGVTFSIYRRAKFEILLAIP